MLSFYINNLWKQTTALDLTDIFPLYSPLLTIILATFWIIKLCHVYQGFLATIPEINIIYLSAVGFLPCVRSKVPSYLTKSKPSAHQRRFRTANFCLWGPMVGGEVYCIRTSVVPASYLVHFVGRWSRAHCGGHSEPASTFDMR